MGTRILEVGMAGLRQEFRELLSTGGLDPGETGSAFDRLAVPHTFQPRMSLAAATFAAVVALVRIFLGSMLFAVWGGCTWALWAGDSQPAVALLNAAAVDRGAAGDYGAPHDWNFGMRPAAEGVVRAVVPKVTLTSGR